MPDAQREEGGRAAFPRGLTQPLSHGHQCEIHGQG